MLGDFYRVELGKMGIRKRHCFCVAQHKLKIALNQTVGVGMATAFDLFGCCIKTGDTSRMILVEREATSQAATAADFQYSISGGHVEAIEDHFIQSS